MDLSKIILMCWS